MKRLPLALSVLALATALRSQTVPQAPITSTTPKAGERPPVAVPALSAPTPVSRTISSTTPPVRALSAETSAKISASGPKFTPPKPADGKAEERPDLRELDKPRNGIIRLPQVMVQEQKLPQMKERELLTPQGKLDLAYKRHPGLRFGSLPFFSNNGIALVMLAEEERLERLAEMTELAGLYRYSDPKTGAAVQVLTNQTSLRPKEWIDSGGSHAEARAR
ncbi:MAG: hypothetical protein ABIZ81_05905 [Opitutaceae bacterium]